MYIYIIYIYISATLQALRGKCFSRGGGCESYVADVCLPDFSCKLWVLVTWCATCNCPGIIVCVPKLQTSKCCSLQRVRKAMNERLLQMIPDMCAEEQRHSAGGGFVKFVFQTLYNFMAATYCYGLCTLRVYVFGFDFQVNAESVVLRIKQLQECIVPVHGAERRWVHAMVMWADGGLQAQILHFARTVKVVIWVCLKIGYTPNYSHLVGIMISKTIGYNGVHNIFRQTHMMWGIFPKLPQLDTFAGNPVIRG